jgi:hypothetical protein
MNQSGLDYRSPWWMMALAIGAVVLLVATFLIGRSVGLRERGTNLQPPKGPPAPFHLRLASGEPVEIQAREHWQYRMVLPARGDSCLLEGRVVGISGGKKDFEILLLSEDDYLNWSTHHEYQSIWQSGEVTVHSISQRVRAPGIYHLVVSNAFSLLATKVVTISADVFCPQSK